MVSLELTLSSPRRTRAILCLRPPVVAFKRMALTMVAPRHVSLFNTGCLRRELPYVAPLLSSCQANGSHYGDSPVPVFINAGCLAWNCLVPLLCCRHAKLTARTAVTPRHLLPFRGCQVPLDDSETATLGESYRHFGTTSMSGYLSRLRRRYIRRIFFPTLLLRTFSGSFPFRACFSSRGFRSTL